MRIGLTTHTRMYIIRPRFFAPQYSGLEKLVLLLRVVDGVATVFLLLLRSMQRLIKLRCAVMRRLLDSRAVPPDLFLVNLHRSLSSSPAVAGCRLGGFSVGRDWWGEKRIVGGVPRINIGTWGLCDRLCLVLVCRGRYGLGGRFISSFWDRVWAE